MNKQKTGVIAEKVKAFLYAFFGVIFFSLGTSYFQEQLVYRVPRILLPIYNMLGNIGLAVGMLLLGGGLIVYGFMKWKRVAKQLSLYWIIIAIALGVGTFLANRSGSKQNSTEIRQDMETERQNQINEIRDTEKPNFNNPAIESYLAEFDDMYKKHEQSIAANNAEAINTAMQEYSDWSAKSAPLMETLDNTQKAELARYMASLGIKWSDLIQKAQK